MSKIAILRARFPQLNSTEYEQGAAGEGKSRRTALKNAIDALFAKPALRNKRITECSMNIRFEEKENANRLETE